MIDLAALKPLLSAIGVFLTFAGFVPYIRGILSNRVKPHVFSWLIWGITTLLVFIAQLQDGAGIGAWPIGISAGTTLVVALLAYLKRGDTSITRMDWLFLAAALSSIPLWYVTANPMWAVIVLTTIDMLGFGPTLRQGWYFPWADSILFFSLLAARNVMVLLALENYSVTTALFPAALGIAALAVIAVLSLRRRTLPAT